MRSRRRCYAESPHVADAVIEATTMFMILPTVYIPVMMRITERIHVFRIKAGRGDIPCPVVRCLEFSDIVFGLDHGVGDPSSLCARHPHFSTGGKGCSRTPLTRIIHESQTRSWDSLPNVL